MKIRAAIFCMLCVIVGQSALAEPVSLSFSAASGTPGAQISFGGGAANPGAGTSTFNFTTGSSGYGFNITSASDPLLNGLGGIISGIWTIGAVNGIGTETESAAVTAGNPGTLRIYQDASNYVLGNISFFNVSTVLDGALGGVSGSGALNVTGWTQNGSISNAGLNHLISEAAGKSTISFNFATAQTLSELVTSTTPQQTAFSGTLKTVAVPEASWGSEFALLSLVGLGAIVHRRLKCADFKCAG